MLPPAARTVLGLPAFLTGVAYLFWCFQGALLTGFLKFWRFRGPRNDCWAALSFLMWAFGVRIRKLPGPAPVADRKMVYLVNHRSWCDFFVDMWALGARPLPLSRGAVGAAFPAFTSSLLSVRSILLFNRKGIKDTEKFNQWLDRELAEGPSNPQCSLLVYPEGHRSQLNKSLPLKRGMLRYVHSRRLPVQVIVTAGKEEVLNESRRCVRFGSTLVTGCSEVLESSRIKDFEEFAKEVQRIWDAEWARVHVAQRSDDLPLLEPKPILDMPYTPAQLAAETAALVFWTATLLWLARFWFRTLVALAAAGPLGTAAVAGLGLWTAASLAAAALLPAPAPRAKPTAAALGSSNGEAAGVAAAAAAKKEG
ncbi:EF hand [Micractinium conductrix]|uniref:EF hand n=1 Tax=Micractinium conductrix TaxID=554055 RepID=A0A2P6VR23_9CHLO|nr:EF hand [Micractinium conductrix]|eukprot:PSC76505.1 EF hand [Micractinium conductrix]